MTVKQKVRGSNLEFANRILNDSSFKLGKEPKGKQKENEHEQEEQKLK